MVKKLDTIKIYEIAESGNTVALLPAGPSNPQSAFRRSTRSGAQGSPLCYLPQQCCQFRLIANLNNLRAYTHTSLTFHSSMRSLFLEKIGSTAKTLIFRANRHAESPISATRLRKPYIFF